MVVGPTGTGFTTTLTRAGDFFLVKQRGDARLLLSRKNVGGSGNEEKPAREPDIAGALLKMFDDYRDEFGALKNARL